MIDLEKRERDEAIESAMLGLDKYEILALGRFLNGEAPTVSTGIHGGLTAGYGHLDSNGFFDQPLPQRLVDLMEDEMNAKVLNLKVRDRVMELKLAKDDWRGGGRFFKLIEETLTIFNDAKL